MSDLRLWMAVALLVGVTAVFFAARRATTICVLQVSAGHVRVVRGALGPTLLGDVADVVRRDEVDALEIVVVRDGGRARVIVRGEASEATAQRLRNVIGAVPFARLIAASQRRR